MDIEPSPDNEPDAATVADLWEDLQLEKCERKLGHTFERPDLLIRAMTHASLKGDGCICNERLEFLGDAVLGMLIAEELWRSFPDADEGELTRIKSNVVSTQSLAREASRLNLGEHFRVGKGMANQMALPTSLLANVFEAVTAAIYLDGGLEATRRFVLESLREAIIRVVNEEHPANYKSILQHWAQKELGLTPTYRVVRANGPDHLRVFDVVAILGERSGSTGSGRSKKSAERAAARATLIELLGSEDAMEDAIRALRPARDA